MGIQNCQSGREYHNESIPLVTDLCDWRTTVKSEGGCMHITAALLN